jgi:hypothetical protein
MSLRDDAVQYLNTPTVVNGQRIAKAILRETDPSPVTAEHLRERGFTDASGTWSRNDFPWQLALYLDEVVWRIGAIEISRITSIGQLDTLLRGLQCSQSQT